MYQIQIHTYYHSYPIPLKLFKSTIIISLPFRVSEASSVKFPGDLRGRIAGCDTLKEYCWSGLESVGLEGVDQLWWFNCSEEKRIIRNNKILQ